MASEKDSLGASLIWGRIGAAVLAGIALLLGIFGYTFSPEDQASTTTLIAGLIAGIGGVMALISKIRESGKVK